MNKKAVVLNGCTYGYYYEDKQYFVCTHNTWGSTMLIINNSECNLVDVNIVAEYEWLEEIPEDYILMDNRPEDFIL